MPTFRPRRKQRNRYHHGGLRRALLDQALLAIGTDGSEALTLRAIASALGVSRTALYRHFADKRALLSTVAAEGFRLLRAHLLEAWTGSGTTTQGDSGSRTPLQRFNDMGIAYVRFAIDNPSYYRVMFQACADDTPCDEDLEREAAAAFEVFIDSMVALQQAGLVSREEPAQLANFIWSAVHGQSMLIIDGQLRDSEARTDRRIRFAVEHFLTGIGTGR